MKLVCNSYAERIPLRYVHHSVRGGGNISPSFSWNDPPPATKSFALSIVDPHPVADNWVHWLVVNVPFNCRSVEEGASRTDRLPAGCEELFNTYGERGYGGPAPPPGSGPHPYVATLYALNTESLGLGIDTPLNRFLRTIDGKVIAEASVTGTFERR